MPGGLMGTGNRGGLMGLDDVSDGSVSTADIANLAVTTGKIANDAVTDTKLRNSAALTVIGRAANSAGDPADIAAVAGSGAVLRESGSALGFGTIATAGIADDAVTNAKLRDSAALTVVGRSANSAGDPADIAAVAESGAVLRESGSVLGFGTIATAGIANNAVTESKLDTTRVLERQAVAGADAQELTFAVSPDDDEVLEIEGFGPCSAAGSHDLTVRINGVTTNVTIQTNSQANGGALSNNDSTRLISLDVSSFLYFRLTLLPKIIGSGVRGGFGHGWHGTTTPKHVYHLFSFLYNDTSTAIATFTLRSSRADGFKIGFVTISRRRKITA